jgi:nitrogen fixation protein
MNRVLNILVEGPTEKEFVSNLIYPYFFNNGISNIRTITIETSPGFKGGDVRYMSRYKPNIQKILRGQEDIIVTSLIDYYRLRNDFPNYENSKRLLTPEQRVTLIEQGCSNDINDARFIPYIQLHEFEGLLFSAPDGFNELFPDLPGENKKELLDIIEKFPNPELINDRPEYAPSKRLEHLIPNYRKPLYGGMIALENGFPSILKKCPRFKNWIDTLIERMKEE